MRFSDFKYRGFVGSCCSTQDGTWFGHVVEHRDKGSAIVGNSYRANNASSLQWMFIQEVNDYLEELRGRDKDEL